MPICSCSGLNPNCFKCGGAGTIGDSISVNWVTHDVPLSSFKLPKKYNATFIKSVADKLLRVQPKKRKSLINVIRRILQYEDNSSINETINALQKFNYIRIDSNNKVFYLTSCVNQSSHWKK